MKENICLQAVTGSRAYGLNHEASDYDRMGVFVAPSLQVSGLRWSSDDESWSNASPDGDDTTYHEIGKFLRLCLKSNPTLIELLFMEDFEILDEIGEEMVGLRSHVLYTKGIENAYIGYAIAQHSRVMREWPDHKLKMSRHCLRIVRQGTELLETGSTSVRVSNPQEYFDLDGLDHDELDMVLSENIEKLKSVKSVLPDSPDEEKIKRFLTKVRAIS